MQLHFMRDKYFQCEKTKRYFYQNYYEECPASK